MMDRRNRRGDLLRWAVLSLAGTVLVASGLYRRHTLLPVVRDNVPVRSSLVPAPRIAEGAAESTAVGDWPNLFGPTHDSISAEQAIVTSWDENGPPEVWRRTIGSGYSAPVVADNKLIIFHRQDDEEIVECLDATDGATLWGFRYPTAYDCPMEYSSGPYSTPIIEGNRVYTLGAEGRMSCLDFDSGSEIWSHDLKSEYQPPERLFPIGASPLLEDNALLLNVGGSVDGTGIVSFEKDTAEVLWRATNDRASYATARAATIHGRRYAFVFTQEGLVALNPKTGELWWRIPFRPKNPDVHVATSPFVEGDVVLVSGHQLGSLCVRVLADGGYEELWRDRRALVSHYNNLIALDGYVYGFSAQDGSLRCLALSTGELQWKWRSVLGRGMALAVGGHIIVLGEHGHLASLKADPHETKLVSLTADAVLATPCYSAPALSHGRLYLRNEGTIICLDVRSP